MDKRFSTSISDKSKLIKEITKRRTLPDEDDIADIYQIKSKIEYSSFKKSDQM